MLGNVANDKSAKGYSVLRGCQNKKQALRRKPWELDGLLRLQPQSLS